MAEDVETNLLVIIFDAHPGQRILQEQPNILTQCLESIIVFGNSHLMLKSTNKLAVLACHAGATDFIFPVVSETNNHSMLRQQDGQYELFTTVDKTLREHLRRLIMDDAVSDKTICSDSPLAGALAMALCYIHRCNREQVIGKSSSRVLIITGSGDSATQYMPYMNAFFTAQKENVIMDVCSLSQDLGLLQQGCDITGGLYLKVPSLPSLLQYLLWVFLPEPAIRSKLVLPPPVKVDYRAACFCHRELVDIGFVCSVCLSIFCKFSPICTTCHAVFKTPGPLAIKPKKKKIKMN